MLQAVVEDFARAPCSVLSTQYLPGITVQSRPICKQGLSKPVFQRCAADADYTLVIAPELQHLLRSRCSWVLEAGGQLLGSTLEAVNLTSDKLALARFLRQRGVQTPDTWTAFPVRKPLNGKAVVKPRWGAGSVDTFLVNVTAARRQLHRDEIVQPYLPGTPASVAWLIGPGQQVPLLPALQRLSRDGRFRYLGGRLPLPAALAQRAIDLSHKAVNAVPGLMGYVGVDIVLGDNMREDYVIEINPRLTTSYLGLRRLAKDNLAEAMLNVVRGIHVPPIRWRKGRIDFSSDGFAM